MKKEMIELDEKTFEMLEEIMRFYNNATGVRENLEETLRVIINTEYLVISSIDQSN